MFFRDLGLVVVGLPGDNVRHDVVKGVGLPGDNVRHDVVKGVGLLGQLSKEELRKNAIDNQG